jgi:hypothetical protein
MNLYNLMERRSRIVGRELGGATVPDEPRKPDTAPPGATPVEQDAAQDAAQPVSGRQPQRPGQHGKYQPHPGQRDPETLPSKD